MVAKTPHGKIENRLLVRLAEKGTREGRGIIPLREVGRITGIDASTLSDWSKNAVKKYDADKLALLCEYLQCQISDLLVYIAALSEPEKPAKKAKSK